MNEETWAIGFPFIMGTFLLEVKEDDFVKIYFYLINLFGKLGCLMYRKQGGM